MILYNRRKSKTHHNSSKDMLEIICHQKHLSIIHHPKFYRKTYYSLRKNNFNLIALNGFRSSSPVLSVFSDIGYSCMERSMCTVHTYTGETMCIYTSIHWLNIFFSSCHVVTLSVKLELTQES